MFSNICGAVQTKKGQEGHRTVPQDKFPRGLTLGQRVEPGPEVALWVSAGVGSREPLLLALVMPRLCGLGSEVLLQPVTCLSLSLLGCPLLPDRIQVPHHHP